jgi:hypothetical protein
MITGRGTGGRVLLEPPTQLPSVHLGEHEVEEHQVGPALARLPEHVGAVRRQDHLEAFAGQRVPNQLGDVTLVLGNQHAGRGTPAEPFTRPPRSHLAGVIRDPHPGTSFAPWGCTEMTGA